LTIKTRGREEQQSTVSLSVSQLLLPKLFLVEAGKAETHLDIPKTLTLTFICPQPDLASLGQAGGAGKGLIEFEESNLG